MHLNTDVFFISPVIGAPVFSRDPDTCFGLMVIKAENYNFNRILLP